jgi:hypothetical protein
VSFRQLTRLAVYRMLYRATSRYIQRGYIIARLVLVIFDIFINTRSGGDVRTAISFYQLYIHEAISKVVYSLLIDSFSGIVSVDAIASKLLREMVTLRK